MEKLGRCEHCGRGEASDEDILNSIDPFQAALDRIHDTQNPKEFTYAEVGEARDKGFTVGYLLGMVQLIWALWATH